MGPDVTNNKSGKSPYAFSNLMQQQVKHFKCCYHDADDIYKFYAIFMKMLTRALRSIWSPWRNKKGATATKQKWCHGNDNENGATATF